MAVKLRKEQRKEKWAKVVQDYQKGMTVAQLVTKYNISSAGLYYILSHFK